MLKRWQILRSSTLSVPLVVILCVGCFFAGRFFRDTEHLPDLRSTASQTDAAGVKVAGTPPLATVGVEAGQEVTKRETLEEEDDDASLETDGDENYLFPLNVEDPTYPGPKEFQKLLDVLDFKQKRPTVPIGESGDNAYQLIPFQVLSWYPRIVLLPNFLDLKQCQKLVAMGQQEIANLASEDEEDTDGMTLGPFGYDDEGVINFFSKRVAAFTRLPENLGEAVRLYRFGPGIESGGYPPNWQSEKRHLANIVVFLSDVEEGGETVFPHEGKDGLNRKFADGEDPCKDPTVFAVPPRIGDALLVWRLNYDGEIDLRSEHWTCPATQGDKWVAAMRIFEVPDVDPDPDPAAPSS